MSEKRKRSLADELRRYGENSLGGLVRMSDEVTELLRSVPKPVDDAANVVASVMPGAGVMESLRLGDEASRLWSDGNYGASIDRWADSLDAPFDDVFWLLPGAGLVRKVTK